MRRLRTMLWTVALSLMAGCALFPGSIEEGLPKLRDKLPETTKVYLPCPINPRGGFLYTRNAKLVVDAFAAALKQRGIATVLADKRSGQQPDVLAQARTNGCDVVLFSQIQEWNYGDAGFSGFGGRDEVTLSVMLMDATKERVLTRATLYVRNGIGRSRVGGSAAPSEAVSPIIGKYVDSLFPPKKDDEQTDP